MLDLAGVFAVKEVLPLLVGPGVGMHPRNRQVGLHPLFIEQCGRLLLADPFRLVPLLVGVGSEPGRRRRQNVLLGGLLHELRPLVIGQGGHRRVLRTGERLHHAPRDALRGEILVADQGMLIGTGPHP